MKKKHWKRIGIAAVVLLFLIYLAAANFLVSAALVPSTMEKLDAFSRITEDSMEALVQTDDIEQQNGRKVPEERK